MTSAKPSATLGFVNRVEEMKRILDALRAAKIGEGRLLLVRGEAGSGKTRLLQEAASEAEKLGFSVGSGTALAESVVPYHAWKEVLEGLGLDTILEEPPPPKLLGFYLLTPEGRIQTKVEREDLDSDLLSNLASTLADSVHESKGQDEVVEGGFTLLSQNGHRILLHRGSTSHLGAVVEGREDEAFLADMMALADKAESIFSGEDIQYEGEEPHQAMEAQMRQLLDSEIYEGIDYAKEDPKLRQNRLFELIALGLSRKAGNHPVFGMIDDLQWADPSSLALLHYVARNTRKTGVFLLGTYRVEEAEARPHLREALEGMEGEELLEEMDLMGLSREDLAELAESFLGSHALPDDFLDLLWQETRGNPLFVREVLLGLEDDGELVSRGVVKRLVCPLDEVALPERVRDVIRARLDRLPREDRQLLDAAATCGTRFTATLVSRVTGEEERNVLNGLTAIAKVHGLLRPTNSGFTFDHPAVQEVLYDGLPTEARQSYHKEAAEWLELAGGSIEDIAEHYYRSGDSRAVAKLYQAAEAALARYANDEASRLLGEALKLAAPEERERLLELQADALEAAARYDEALAALDMALEFGAPLPRCKRKIASIRIHQGLLDDSLAACEEGLRESEGAERGRLLTLQGEALSKKGEHSEAAERINDGLIAFGEGGNQRDRANALSTLGMARFLERRYDEAERIQLQALALHETIGNLRDVGTSLNLIGIVLHRKSDDERALEFLRKSLSIREAIGDLDGISASLNNIGSICLHRGEFSRSLELFKRALNISKSIGNRLWIAKQTHNISHVYADLGDYERAIELLEESLTMKEATGNPEAPVITMITIGNARYMQGDMDSAFECFQRSLSISDGRGYGKGIVLSLTGMGMVFTEKGDPPSALRVLRRALAVSEELEEPFIHAQVLDALVFALIRSEKLPEAKRRAEEELEISQKGSWSRMEALSHLNLARWETASGNPDAARGEFLRSVLLFKEIKADVYAADTYFEWGIAEREWENQVVSREHLEGALELFQSRNITRKADRTLEALKGLKLKPGQ